MNSVAKQYKKISVIIPIYNAQDYLERCLDSILAQTYPYYEVICIDDGSWDDSGVICDRYAKEDMRIRVFHIENGGVSAARNYGLSVMEGEWFAFVDADDWLEPEFFETLYLIAEENACDIVACNFRRDTEYVIGCEAGENRIVTLHSSEQCIRNFIGNKDSMQGMVWNKLYKAEVCRHVTFNTGIKINEDCLYTYDVMSICKKACYITLPLYHWYQRSDSACHSKTTDADFSPANVFLELYDKTLEYQDCEVQRVLQKNYVMSVIKILLYSKYKSNDVEVKKARAKSKEWRGDIWGKLSVKEKIKYVLAIDIYRVLRK